MSPDFWNDALEYEMLFGNEDENVECLHCGRKIKGNEKVIWIDKKSKIFQCPGCNKEIKT